MPTLPTAPKTPMLLTVLIDTGRFRWYVAGIGLDAAALPLVRSDDRNLAAYLDAPFDEQVSFLRHRLSGVLQRGCDRLWGQGKKPCRVIFVADGEFAQADAELTSRVASHFVEWMTNPPVAFFTGTSRFTSREFGELRLMAGDLPEEYVAVFQEGLTKLLSVLHDNNAWELAPNKPRS